MQQYYTLMEVYAPDIMWPGNVDCEFKHNVEAETRIRQ